MPWSVFLPLERRQNLGEHVRCAENTTKGENRDIGAVCLQQSYVQMFVSRYKQTSTYNLVAFIVHIQQTHVVRQAYKSIFSEYFSENFTVISCILLNQKG
jgi:hypothetical protein